MTKILLVEDDKSLQEIYGVRLGSEGYSVLIAGDGEEALNIALKEKPDLILSDVMMPKISGFDMLDILRTTPEIKDTKVIIMTALSSEDQRERGEKLGANIYLVKSQVGIEDVVQAVKNLLNDQPNNGQNLGAEEVSEMAAQEASTHPLPTEPTDADFESAKAQLRDNILQPEPIISDQPTPTEEQPVIATTPTEPQDTPAFLNIDQTPLASFSAPVAESQQPSYPAFTEETLAEASPTPPPAPASNQQPITINPQYRQPTSLRDLIPERDDINGQ